MDGKGRRSFPFGAFRLIFTMLNFKRVFHFCDFHHQKGVEKCIASICFGDLGMLAVLTKGVVVGGWTDDELETLVAWWLMSLWDWSFSA